MVYDVICKQMLSQMRTFVALAVLILLAVIATVRFVTSPQAVESPERLTETALHDPSAERAEKAAVRLEALACKLHCTGTRNAAQPLLVRLVNESALPGVRTAGMRGLATIWDYQCVPQMLDLLDDPSPQVRSTAASVVCKLMDATNDFDARAPAEQRAASAKKLRDFWNLFKGRTLQSWQRRLEEKDAKS
jgi:hypothetical protein